MFQIAAYHNVIRYGYNQCCQVVTIGAGQIGSTVKVSKEESERNRTALLNAASELFRERGFEQVSIADIAAAASLTHGAFYTHFSSKEAFCAEVVEHAIAKLEANVRAGKNSRRKKEEAYLSVRHVEHRGGGCPLAALSGDIGREHHDIRAAFSGAIDRLFEAMAAEEPLGTQGARDRAIVSMVTRIGAVVLARATTNPKLRDEILDAAKRALVNPASLIAPTASSRQKASDQQRR
jgi:TetR/AcrR family transcriptional repressor of nem operon